MHSLRSSRHLFQFMSKSALPEVSVGRSRSLARKASQGTSSDPLRASGLHPAPSFGPVGLAEQEGPLRSPVSYQCGNPSRSGARSETSRGRNRLLHRAAHRELKTRHSPTCTFRRARGWSFAQPHPLVFPTLALLSAPRLFPSCFSSI